MLAKRHHLVTACAAATLALGLLVRPQQPILPVSLTSTRIVVSIPTLKTWRAAWQLLISSHSRRMV